VYSGQTSFFTEPFLPYEGLVNDRFDYNCDGVEERLYDSYATNVCCVPIGGRCLALVMVGCDPPGWNAGSASGIPECGEADQLLTCGGTAPACYSTTVTATQACR
jgi:hypothetical protein